MFASVPETSQYWTISNEGKVPCLKKQEEILQTHT